MPDLSDPGTFRSEAPATAVPEVSVARSRPGYLVPMTVLTLCYLVVELGFNARLLDVTAGIATTEEVAVLERWGRALSGVAVGLAVWSWFVIPKARRKGWPGALFAVVLSTSMAASVAGMWRLQQGIVDGLVERSDGEGRRAAAHLRAVTAALARGVTTVEGADFAPETWARPEGKAFLAVFPLVASSAEDVEQRTGEVLREALRRSAVDAYGSPERAWNRGFVPSVASLRDSYRAYADGVARRSSALAGIPEQQARAWRDFEADLARRNRRPGNVPRAYWNEAAAAVRGRGIPVPAGWNPADRGAFDRALAANVRSKADDAFREETARLAGGALPPDLGWAEFCAHPAVQDRWRATLAVPEGIRLRPDASFASWREAVYLPTIERGVAARLEILLRPAAEFADGGAHAEEGRRAMEGLVVPPIALAFSLVGALLHLGKGANYLARMAAPGFRLRVPVVASAVVAAGLAVFLAPNDVTRSPAFASLQERTQASFSGAGPAIAAATRWVVQAQPFFYPANEGIRRTVLGGFDFGYEGAPAREAAPAAVADG